MEAWDGQLELKKKYCYGFRLKIWLVLGEFGEFDVNEVRK